MDKNVRKIKEGKGRKKGEKGEREGGHVYVKRKRVCLRERKTERKSVAGKIRTYAVTEYCTSNVQQIRHYVLTCESPRESS